MKRGEENPFLRLSILGLVFSSRMSPRGLKFHLVEGSSLQTNSLVFQRQWGFAPSVRLRFCSLQVKAFA